MRGRGEWGRMGEDRRGEEREGGAIWGMEGGTEEEREGGAMKGMEAVEGMEEVGGMEVVGYMGDGDLSRWLVYIGKGSVCVVGEGSMP